MIPVPPIHDAKRVIPFYISQWCLGPRSLDEQPRLPIATIPNSMMSAFCYQLTPICNLLVPIYTAAADTLPSYVIIATMVDHSRGARVAGHTGDGTRAAELWGLNLWSWRPYHLCAAIFGTEVRLHGDCP